MGTSERGQTTVELALCLPVVILVLAAFVEVVGLSIDQLRVWHAAREGARLAAVEPDETVVEAAARRSLGAVAVTVSPGRFERIAGEPVAVEIAYRPSSSIPLLDGLFASLRLRARVVMRVEVP